MPYCDHNATAPLRPEARDAMLAALAMGGNPSSVHAAGRAARALIAAARERVAAMAGAGPDAVVFTSGATESNALALWGAVQGARDAADGGHGAPVTRILVSAIEHSSILKAAARLCERIPGVTMQVLPATGEGMVDTHALACALDRGNTRALVAVMAANNETGVVQPVADVSRLCRGADALLLVDAVAAAGRIDLDFSLCDYMTVSAHKLGGPQGAGALIVRDDAPLAPQLVGGGQQRGLRAGTENLPGIAGFGAVAATHTPERARIAAIRDGFEAALATAIPDAVLFGATVPRLCGTSNFALPGLQGETVVMALDLDGIAVASGSACSSGSVTPSHVLSAMGVGKDLAKASVRVSFGWNSTLADGEAVVAALSRLWGRATKRAAA